eukprot:GILI01016627.1.p1 GENE.GILI01016627.1~~GILI01016627.1.p1  ORF type:complete len:314 (-),score=23.88 GILI01016627.1:57-998(-)
MNRQNSTWSNEDVGYRPAAGLQASVPMHRQPSAQGFAGQQQPGAYQPQAYNGAFQPQQPTYAPQQFMPTQYAAPLPQGLSQRTPSVTNMYHQPPTVPGQAFGGGQHEIGIRAATPSTNAIHQQHVEGGPTGTANRFGHPEDDLPLLEELGIHSGHIKGKAIAVLHPLGRMRDEAIQDPDLAGPFVFAVVLGFLLSLQGKVQFSAIYGLSSLGMFAFRILIGLMSDEDVRILHIVSTLGYCLLPNLILATVQTVLLWATGSHRLALPFALCTVLWSAWCACQMFAKLYSMEHQRFLLLYPLTMFYSVFAAMTIF